MINEKNVQRSKNKQCQFTRALYHYSTNQEMNAHEKKRMFLNRITRNTCNWSTCRKTKFKYNTDQRKKMNSTILKSPRDILKCFKHEHA